jgi:hypothetical protein
MGKKIPVERQHPVILIESRTQFREPSLGGLGFALSADPSFGRLLTWCAVIASLFPPRR